MGDVPAAPAAGEGVVGGLRTPWRPAPRQDTQRMLHAARAARQGRATNATTRATSAAEVEPGPRVESEADDERRERTPGTSAGNERRKRWPST